MNIQYRRFRYDFLPFARLTPYLFPFPLLPHTSTQCKDEEGRPARSPHSNASMKSSSIEEWLPASATLRAFNFVRVSPLARSIVHQGDTNHVVLRPRKVLASDPSG